MTQHIRKVNSFKNIFSSIKPMNQNEKICDKTKNNQVQAKGFEKYEIIVQSEHLQNEIKHIQWRSKTEFPIVKILSYKMLQKKLLNECSVVQVTIENYIYNMNNMPALSFNQMIYIIKESLVGFQRLYDRFGPFDPSSKMILINKNNKCKVWINENVTLNYPARKNRISENQFLQKILKMFEAKTIQSALSNQFFKNIIRTLKLIQSIQFIDSFTKNYKVIIPIKLRITNEKTQITQISPIIKYGYLSLKGIPKWVPEVISGDKKRQIDFNNKSFDSLGKRPVNKQKRDLSINKLVCKNNDKEGEVSLKVRPVIPISNSPKILNKADEKQVKSRKLTRYLSIQDINPYATMVPISRPAFLDYQKQIRPKNASKYLNHNEDINVLKNQQKSAHQISEKNIFNLKGNGKDILKDYKKNVEGSNVSSQFTAATLQQSKVHKTKPLLQGLIEHAPKITHLKFDQKNIFQKNGWNRRLNTLTNGPTNFRQTIQSQHEGQDTFSDTYLRTDECLHELGSMCKELKKSIIQE